MAVRTQVARSLLYYQWEVSEAAAAVQQRVQMCYDYEQHLQPDSTNADLIPEVIVPEFALAGTASDVRAQVLDLFDQGIDVIQVRLWPIDGQPRSTAIDIFAKEIIEPLRGIK